VIDPLRETDSNNPFDQKVKKFLMDRSILKVHLPNGGFNMVKYGGKFRMGKLQSSLLS
jgi:hypothetical protein